MKPQIIEGMKVTNTHYGQKRAYGDNFYEYEIESDKPAEEVERVCRETVYKALPKAQYDREYVETRSMENAFRPHYTFKSRGDGKYFYSVCSLYTD